MDAAIAKVSIAQQAEIAARLAAATFEHQPNPHPEGSDDYRQWAAAYARYFAAYVAPEGEASA